MLILATFLVYAPVRKFEFLNFDDPDYVTSNVHVRRGLTADGVALAMRSGQDANWFPLTRLSHMLDVQFFGLDSGLHHLTNVLLHALAATFLFAFLFCATRARGPSAFVAFMFALHPLHVESVAWVAERKDVLSALFWFLALWAYVCYAEKPTWRKYGLLVAAFCLGLMSKPMIVTLPFVLLLLDIWPLRRRMSAPIFREKIPLFLLSAVSAALTYVVQRGSGAVEAVTVHPLGLRIENGLVSYIIYIARMVWPARLAVFYPYPAQIPAWQAIVAAIALTGVSILAVRQFRRRPYLMVGWLWYLGTLVPVIGLVQVGGQAHADRYMYVPMVGLSIMLAWGLADLVRPWPRVHLIAAAASVAASIAMAAGTWAQLLYWRNSVTLFEHALAVTRNNDVAEHNLGNALLNVPGRLDDAIAHLDAALQIRPESPKARTDLGIALTRVPGRSAEAVAQFEAALRMLPDSAVVHNDLGNALSTMPASLPRAVAEYETALRIEPEYAEAHNNLGTALSKLGRTSEAIREFQAALRIEPGYSQARDNLARAVSQSSSKQDRTVPVNTLSNLEAAVRAQPGSAEAHSDLANALSRMPERLPEAISEYEAALRIDPNSAELHYNLGVARSKAQGQLREAIEQFEVALRIRPNYAEAHNNLGVALTQVAGRSREAISHFASALQLRPDFADAHYNLGVALANSGKMREALEHFEAAERIRPDPGLEQTIIQLRTAQK